MKRWAVLVASSGLFVGAVSGCAGKAAHKVRPGDPSYARTVGERCTSGDAEPKPLVVDWRAEERTDLEVAMRRGVVVVAYDCERLRVLPDCTTDGGYGFVAVTPKTQQLKLTNKDEIQANLPAGVLAANASLQRGAALDVNLSIVGKQMSSVVSVDGARLRGRCQGATHFVRAVTTGAFTLATHTDANVKGEAGLKGAGVSAAGSSEKQLQQADGDPAACATVTASSTTPPQGCSTPLRLDLISLGTFARVAAPSASAGPGAAQASATGGVSSFAQPDAGACPRGLVWSMGACKAQSEAALMSCKGAQGIAECRRMCEEENNARACSNLGFSYLEGRYIELNRAKALALFERACRQNDEYGCSNLGGMLLVGAGVPANPKRGLELALQACYLEPKLCGNAAVAYRDGLGTPVNFARSVELFSRGCIGGSADECSDVATAYSNGRGVPKDVARAAELQDIACRGGYMHACAALGSDYLYGRGVDKDPRRAAELSRYACERGKAPFGCTMFGVMMIGGEGGIPKDPSRGYDLMKWGCENDERGANCAVLGEVYQTQGDRNQARSYMRRSCDAGFEPACQRMKELRYQ